MQSEYFIGVDGGGTRCRLRLVDQSGQILAQCHGGAANIYSDFSVAMQTVMRLIDQAMQMANLDASAYAQTSVVLGLAGANVQVQRQKAQAFTQAFAQYQVVSDVEIACFGAHQGNPGAVLIVGTGSQGASWNGQKFSSLGGWGLTLSDQGSGARLGQQALRVALQAHEGLLAHTPLTEILMTRFEHAPESLLNWATHATPAAWGQFAPLIFTHALQHDLVAELLVEQLAQEITQMLDHLTGRGHYVAALMGGIAEPILPWLSTTLRDELVLPQGDAIDGALLLARHHELSI